MGKSNTPVFWVPTSGSSTQIETVGLAPASGFQDVRCRNLATTGTATFGSTATAQTTFQAANGTAAAPSYTFTNSTATGLYRAAADVIGVTTAGTARFAVQVSSLVGISTAVLGFAPGADPTVAADTGISRLAANSIALGNGTAADRSALLSCSGVGFGTGVAASGQVVGSSATVVVSTPILNLSQTWNAALVTFEGMLFNATNTASAVGSRLLNLQLGGLSAFNVTRAGIVNVVSGGVYGLSSSATDATTAADVAISRQAANVLAVGTGAQGNASGSLLVGGITLGASTTAPASNNLLGNASAALLISTQSNQNISLSPNGTGIVSINANTTITGKLTVTGDIDPTSVSLSSGTALFYESANGSTAAVAPVNKGRIRYLDGTGWQLSLSAGAYATVVTTATGTLQNAYTNGGGAILETLAGGPVALTSVAGQSTLTLAGGTQTLSNPALTISQTWNAALVTFEGVLFNATSTASAAGSRLLNLQLGGSSAFNIVKTGIVNVVSGGVYGFSSSATDATTSADTAISRDAAGVIDFGTGAAASTAGSYKATNGTLLGGLSIGPTAAAITAGQLVFGTGGGAISQILGPSDQTFQVKAGRSLTMLAATIAAGGYDVLINSGDANGGSGGFGGTTTVRGGAGDGAGAAGLATFQGGAGGATSNGGAVSTLGGVGGATSGNGGANTCRGGHATTSGVGGALTLYSGNGVGANQTSGTLTIGTGDSTGNSTPSMLVQVPIVGAAGSGVNLTGTVLTISGAGFVYAGRQNVTTVGAVTITASQGGSTSGAGGAVTFTGGAAGTAGGATGTASLVGGANAIASGSTAGGQVLVTGGACSGTTSTGAGGACTLAGGLGGTTSGTGGAASLTGGAGQGTTSGVGGLASLVGGAGSTGSNNNAAGGVTISTGLSSGNATSDILNQTSYMLASGSAAQTAGDRYRIVGKTKALSTVSGTLTLFANIVVGTTLTGGNGTVYYCVTAKDGADIDTASGHFDFTVVNKAGVLTVTAGTITDVKASTSGSITSGVTVTASGTTCQLNVTPVFTTIAPTTVNLDWQIVWNGSPVAISVQ